MTRVQFLVSFPEFSEVDTSLLDAKLAEAILEVDPTVWDVRTDTGIGYLTAHKLAISPMGGNARLVNKDGTTTFLGEYQSLKRKVAVGLRST